MLQKRVIFKTFTQCQVMIHDVKIAYKVMLHHNCPNLEIWLNSVINIRLLYPMGTVRGSHWFIMVRIHTVQYHKIPYIYLDLLHSSPL